MKTAPELPRYKLQDDGHIVVLNEGHHPSFVTLYPVGGGPPIQRWSVDARDMIKSGEFTLEPPA